MKPGGEQGAGKLGRVESESEKVNIGVGEATQS